MRKHPLSKDIKRNGVSHQHDYPDKLCSRQGISAVQRPNIRSLPGIVKKQQGDSRNDMKSQGLEGILEPSAFCPE